MKLALTFIVLMWVTPAYSQALCGPYKKMISKLFSDYRETPIGRGLTSSKNMVEVWTSDKATWSIIIKTPDGNACLGAVGKHWQDSKRKPTL